MGGGDRTAQCAEDGPSNCAPGMKMHAGPGKHVISFCDISARCFPRMRVHDNRVLFSGGFLVLKL